MNKMFKGLDALRKKLVIVRKGDKRPRKVGVMVCGDFNSGGRTAVRELLTKGEIHKEFREFDDGADEVCLLELHSTRTTMCLHRAPITSTGGVAWGCA